MKKKALKITWLVIVILGVVSMLFFTIMPLFYQN